MKETTVISIIALLLFVKCELPKDIEVYESAPIVEPVDINDEPMEVIKMNDFTVKPVEVYPAYYVDPAGRVFGVNTGLASVEDFDPMLPVVSDNGGEDAEGIFDSFFVVAGVVYFTVTRYFPGDPNVEGDTGESIKKYFSQVSGDISEESKFPEMGDPVRGVFDDGEATLSVEEYAGNPISTARRKSDPVSYFESFLLVDGMIRADGGYFIHVIKGRGSSRMPGILYWKDGLMRMDHTGKDAGRFWMM